jgi:TonB family protein
MIDGSWVSTLFEVLIAKSVGLSLLIIVILSLRPLVMKWLNARVAYGLWLILPIFLFLPSNFIEQAANSQVITFFSGAAFLLPSIQPDSIFNSSGLELVVLITWFVGALVSIIFYLISYQTLKRSLMDFDYQLPAQQLTQKTHYNTQSILIKNTDLFDVPAVFGLFNATLILPKNFNAQSEDKQLMILKHEFYHLERRDHQINFLRVLIKSLFWFNPLVYWANKFVEADQEISCDLGVLRTSPTAEKKKYAKALIESVGGLKQDYVMRQSNLVSQWKYQSLIKQRIKMMKNTNQKNWHSWVAAGLAITSIWATSLVVAGDKDSVISEELVPVVVIEPKFPTKALNEGVEGWVKVQMSVGADGQPFYIRVADSSPKELFDNSAMRAIKRWKFKPKIVNGKAVIQKNMYYTLEFKIDGVATFPQAPPMPEVSKK